LVALTQAADHKTPSICALKDPFEAQSGVELGLVGLHALASSATSDTAVTFHLTRTC